MYRFFNKDSNKVLINKHLTKVPTNRYDSDSWPAVKTPIVSSALYAF